VRRVRQNSINCLLPYYPLIKSWPVTMNSITISLVPLRHFPHSNMISTAHSFSCPTALAVALGGRCRLPISQYPHLIARSSLMTRGEDRWSFYLRFLQANIKTAILTPGQRMIMLFLHLTVAKTLGYIMADCQDSCRPSLCICVYIIIYLSFQARCFENLSADI
jgi:hypothetical protein